MVSPGGGPPCPFCDATDIKSLCVEVLNEYQNMKTKNHLFCFAYSTWCATWYQANN